MSLINKTENTLEISDKLLNDREIYLYKNKNNLNPIKINKSSDKYISNNKTIVVNNNNNHQMRKGDENLINSNKLLTYLKNIKKDHIYQNKYLPSKSRNNNKLIANNIFISKSTNTNNNYILDNSPKDFYKYYINRNYVKINTLFNLPKITKKNSPYNFRKTINISSKNLNDNIREKLTEINRSNQKSYSLCNKKTKLVKESKKVISKSTQVKDDIKDNKVDKHNNIYSFMKFKYYEDVNDKMEKKLKDDSFIDRGVKEKIIQIEKVGVFWRNVFEYCGSYIFAEKFRNIKKYINNKMIKEDEEKSYKNSKTPNKKLYTNELATKLILYKKRSKKNNC